MSGICGWSGSAGGDPSATIERMASRFAWRAPQNRVRVAGTRFGLAAAGPVGTFAIHQSGPIRLAVQGHPEWRGEGSGVIDLDTLCGRTVAGYLARGNDVLASIGGDFALALIDERSGDVLLAIDRIGVRNVIYHDAGEAFVFGASSDVINAHSLARRTVAPQALYDYVYFHMVPGPETVFREHTRLLPGHCLAFGNGRVATLPYWQMHFAEDESRSLSVLAPAFRDALRTGVAAFAGGGRCGTFLSGGTDSSTVSGMLGALRDGPVDTYSIGFEAAGYDEMEYARIASKHFATRHHEYYVTPDDVVRAIPVIAAAYDQPFGNASAIPTYCCARFAREDGIDRMLGGDGGDELFGGNSRYAKQYQFALYERIPRAVRKGVLEALLVDGPDISRVPLLRKARSYVEQARLPMPARYETYNLLERLGPGNVFDAGFLAQIDRNRPLAELTAAYRSAHAESLINRMLALDLKFTLADNDLPKVTRTCDIAGVDVAFPLLHHGVVDFSARLAPDLKLHRTRLRYFFKKALRDFLPAEIIAKEKHGFGLPAGVWLRDFAPLNQLAGDSLASLRRRKIFRGDLLDGLTSRHLREHPGYYGTLTWVLMMLELWFQHHVAG
ncbi:MAG: asparagine synthase [Aromatoleum sp.]|nr:asparagine synthase [Aromatoleum sp.]